MSAASRALRVDADGRWSVDCDNGHTPPSDGDGAVSGSWWKGPLQGVPEGFGVVDLRPDGTFEHRYEAYGWKARS